MEKKKIRVAFIDNCESQEILEALGEKYNPVLDERDPEVVFYGNFGLKHLRYNCIKVFISQECVAADFNVCDYAMTSNKVDFDGRNLYMPPAFFQHLREEKPYLCSLTPQLSRRRFCSFIYSQRKEGLGSQLRAEFCERLMKYKQVDCPGKVLHNYDAPELSLRHANDWNASKIRFLSNYKFNIAFENCNCRGYITEKMSDPLLAGCVPIYWGSEGDLGLFPKEAVIYANDYPSIDALIERVIEVDNNDEEYMRILEANPLRHGVSLARWNEFRDFVLHVADTSSRPEMLDSMDHGDVAVLRLICNNRIILAAAALYSVAKYCAQRLVLGCSRTKEDSSKVVSAYRTKRVAHLMLKSLCDKR